MSTTVRVTLLCFSHIKAALGRDSMILDLTEGARAADVEARVRAMAPEKLGELPFRIAVNKTFVNAQEPLRDGDEITLIPPVQGG